MKRLKYLIPLLTKGEIIFILKGIKKRVYSEVVCYGLRRDLNVIFKKPKAEIELQVRLTQNSDSTYFRDENHNLGLLEANIKNCFVATTKDGHPCLRIWLMESSQNEKIKNFFTGNFPILNKDEALIESAFTLASYRGKRIMPEAIEKILEKRSDNNIRYVICFVNKNNIPSLRSYKYAGFLPYTIRLEKWFLFRKKIRFVEIPNDLLEKYNLMTSGI